MKKVMLIPAVLQRLSPVFTDQFFVLSDRIREDYGFEIVFASRASPYVNNAAVAVVFAGAHGKDLLVEAAVIKRSTKLILYLGGMHSFINKKNLLAMVMERADHIICGCNEMFLELWPRQRYKFTFFPNFFAPHSRYVRQRWRKNPIMKCLLSGHNERTLYPLRAKVKDWAKSTGGAYAVVMRHPRWTKPDEPLKRWETAAVMKDQYAAIINKYFCALATGSRYQYALAKYFEIPAAGSLLVGIPNEDVETAGLKPWIHYVPASAENVLDVIQGVIDMRYPALDTIRRQGREYVREHHSVENRVKLFGSILRRL